MFLTRELGGTGKQGHMYLVNGVCKALANKSTQRAEKQITNIVQGTTNRLTCSGPMLEIRLGTYLWHDLASWNINGTDDENLLTT